jgi:hypothetical protein
MAAWHAALGALGADTTLARTALPERLEAAHANAVPARLALAHNGAYLDALVNTGGSAFVAATAGDGAQKRQLVRLLSCTHITFKSAQGADPRAELFLAHLPWEQRGMLAYSQWRTQATRPGPAAMQARAVRAGCALRRRRRPMREVGVGPPLSGIACSSCAQSGRRTG